MMGDKDVLSLVLFEVLLLVNSNIRFKGGRQTNMVPKHKKKNRKKHLSFHTCKM